MTETFDCARWPAHERTSIENGRIWIAAMTRTLEHLGELCAARPAGALGAPVSS